MTTDDREYLGNIRTRLHAAAMACTVLQDLALARELEDDIDTIIAKISKKLQRKTKPLQGG